MTFRILPTLSVAASLSACSCPPPVGPAAPGGPSPGHGEEAHGAPAGHHAHGAPEGHSGDGHGAHGGHAHGAHEHGGHDPEGGPLVHRFTEGGEFWRAKFEEPGRDASQKPADVIRAMRISPEMTVADIGAGSGYFMKHLAEAVPLGRVLEIDIEPTMVRYLKKRASDEGLTHVEPRLGLTDDPLLADGSVSRVLIVNTWHHIPDRVAYAKKLWSALQAPGEVFIVDFNKTTKRGPKPEHRLDSEAVAAELTTAGFTTRIDDELLPDQYIVVGVRPAEIR